MQAEKKSKEKKNNYTSLKDNFPASCTSSIQIDKCFYWLCPRVLSDEAMASLKKIFFKLKEIIYIFKNIDNLFGVWGLNIIIIINNLYLTSDLKKKYIHRWEWWLTYKVLFCFVSMVYGGSDGMGNI